MPQARSAMSTTSCTCGEVLQFFKVGTQESVLHHGLRWRFCPSPWKSACRVAQCSGHESLIASWMHATASGGGRGRGRERERERGGERRRRRRRRRRGGRRRWGRGHVSTSRNLFPIWRTISPRLGAGIAAQSARASSAACVHRCRSAGVPILTLAMTSPVAGATASLHSPLAVQDLPSYTPLRSGRE
jgi:hypothetical protein